LVADKWRPSVGVGENELIAGRCADPELTTVDVCTAAEQPMSQSPRRAVGIHRITAAVLT
jgi:hypothetical protein